MKEERRKKDIPSLNLFLFDSIVLEPLEVLRHLKKEKEKEKEKIVRKRKFCSFLKKKKKKK